VLPPYIEISTMSENIHLPTEEPLEDDELYSDIDESQTICERYLGLACGRFVFYVSLVLGMGIYLGNLLFGTSSLEVLLGLDEYENYLHTEIERYKNENAQMQKEYFELKELDSDSKN